MLVISKIRRLAPMAGLLGLVACGADVTDQQAANQADTLAQRAGAPLFEGMGDYHMPITTADPDAQSYFDQGMVLAFGFNHAESIRSFRAAQTLDPTCAMCFGVRRWQPDRISTSRAMAKRSWRRLNGLAPARRSIKPWC